MEDALGTIVDAITSILLVFEEAEVKDNARMFVHSTADIENVIDGLCAVGPSSIKGAPEEYKQKIEPIMEQLQSIKKVLSSYSNRQLEKSEGKIFVGLFFKHSTIC